MVANLKADAPAAPLAEGYKKYGLQNVSEGAE